MDAVHPPPGYPWYALVDDPANVVVVSPDWAARQWMSAAGSTVVAAEVLDRVPANSEVEVEQLARARALFELPQPGGEVWLSVGNRLSFLHLVGVKPAHSRAFEPLLPRSVVTALRRWTPFATRSAMRSAVLTQRGYRQLLRSAGFDDVQFYLAFFDSREPDFVVNSSGSNSLRRYLRSVRYSRSMKSRLAMAMLAGLERTRLINQLAPAFIIRARRP